MCNLAELQKIIGNSHGIMGNVGELQRIMGNLGELQGL